MEEYVPFKGNLKVIKLKSIVSGFFLPRTVKEVKQHITIKCDGRVWITRYGFRCHIYSSSSLSCHVYPKYEKKKTDYYKISKESVDTIFELVSSFFEKEYEPDLVDDVGVWECILTNEDGQSFFYSGSLVGNYLYNEQDICDIIRTELSLPDLLLFDGKARKEFVSTLKATFNINNRIEKLYLDYKKCELSLSIEKNEENTTLTIKSPNKIKAFLEEFEFEEWLYFPEDDKRKTNRRYQITIKSNKGNAINYEGSYDFIGLPHCWLSLVTFIEENVSIKDFKFLKFQIFQKKYPKEDEIIYCSVSFGSSLRTYYYICDCDDVDEKDNVLVPVGDDNSEKIGIVQKIEFFNKHNVPYPVEKTKHIISIYKEGDMIPPKDNL